MAQLKSTVVQGSLRVTDTVNTANENISSLSASQAVITDTNKNLISRDIYNKTATGNLEWTAAGTDIHLVTKNTLAYWNGRYNSSTSNLAYCNKGAFGDMAIKTKGNGFSDSSNTISIAYGTTANTAVQGNQTIFTLNGSAKNSGSSASFYAPTGGGTAGYILKAGGNATAPDWIQTVPIANGGTGTSTAPTQYGVIYASTTSTYASTAKGVANAILTASGTDQAPAWTTAASIASATSTIANTAAYTDLILGNEANVSTTTAHSEGRIKLYSAATKAHILQGASTTTDYTHILPNSTGWVATGGDGSTTGVGSTSAPIFLSTSGILTETGIIDIAHGGTGVSGAADHFVLIGKTVNSTSTLEWRGLLGSDLLGAIKYGGDMPTGNDVVTGTIWMRPTTFSIDELRCYIAQFSNISNTTFYDANIKQQMVVVNYMLSNPAAIAGDLIWNTGDGSITFSGTFVGTTDITLYLVPERGV